MLTTLLLSYVNEFTHQTRKYFEISLRIYILVRTRVYILLSFYSFAMKKLLVSIISLLFILWLSACTINSSKHNNTDNIGSWSLQKTIDGFLSYHNSHANFSIQYPQNWELQENTLGSQVLFLSPQNSGDLFRENVSVVTENLNDNITVDSYYDAAKVHLQKFINNFEEISNKNMNIGNLNAKIVEYIGTQGTYNLKRQQIFLIKNQTAYIITYTASRNHFDDTLDLVQKMVESISID